MISTVPYITSVPHQPVCQYRRRYRRLDGIEERLKREGKSADEPSRMVLQQKKFDLAFTLFFRSTADYSRDQLKISPEIISAR